MLPLGWFLLRLGPVIRADGPKTSSIGGLRVHSVKVVAETETVGIESSDRLLKFLELCNFYFLDLYISQRLSF